MLCHSECLLFADDFKVFKAISTEQDCLDFQIDLNAVSKWFVENEMSLNVEKCCTMTYTRKNKFLEHEYLIENRPLQRRDGIRDLGVNMQSNLKFNDHYRHIVNKALKKLGFVIRNSRNFVNCDTVILLYNALVRSQLEYASIIWSPRTLSSCDLIERVQKRFLRYLYVRQNNAYPYMISYVSMLRDFNFQKLEERRQIQAVIFVFNIVNNLRYGDCSLINFIPFYVPKVGLRMRKEKLFQCEINGCSPLNFMLLQCNELILKTDIDMFNTSARNIVAAFNVIV